jgi:hypothetical protein
MSGISPYLHPTPTARNEVPKGVQNGVQNGSKMGHFRVGMGQMGLNGVQSEALLEGLWQVPPSGAGQMPYIWYGALLRRCTLIRGISGWPGVGIAPKRAPKGVPNGSNPGSQTLEMGPDPGSRRPEVKTPGRFVASSETLRPSDPPDPRTPGPQIHQIRDPETPDRRPNTKTPGRNVASSRHRDPRSRTQRPLDPRSQDLETRDHHQYPRYHMGYVRWYHQRHCQQSVLCMV